jgi:hypothetical protein
MSGTKVPRDPSLSQEMRRFLDDLARLTDTLNGSGFATLASPTFTGDPKAPTALPGDNDTSIATTAFVTAAVAAAPRVVRQVLQNVYTSNADIDGGTAANIIPLDDTTPTSSEGVSILSQAITPADNTNKVLCSVCVNGSLSAAPNTWSAALFRGTTCIAAVPDTADNANRHGTIAFEFLDSPATASSVTYSVRVGPAGASVLRLNGTTASRVFGGVCSCTLTLSEIEA